MKYKFWNKTDSLTAPTGKEFTAEEILAKYAWAKKEKAKVIICDSVIELGVFYEFEQTKEMYRKMGAAITDDMTDDEVLEAINNFVPPVPEASVEERTAAALEFIAMSSLPDVE